MALTIVDAAYNEYLELRALPGLCTNISLSSYLDNIFSRFLLVSATSIFEQRIKQIVIGLINKHAKNKLVNSFINVSRVEREYHKWFEWDAELNNRKPSYFFSLFGKDFKNEIESAIEQDGVLSVAMSDFLELGHIRNRLVHINFAAFPFEKNVDEVYGSYQSASKFIDFLEQKLL